jgi:beta-glucosidase
LPVKSRTEGILSFPKNFLWGTAISAYQTEGGNTNNQWYKWESEGGHIKDGSVCGRAADFYHLYERDLDLARELGLNTFRFSVEWSRIEPREGEWNIKEVEHYRDVLKATRKRGLEPLITLHHFTNPLWMEAQGAWVNPKSVELFRRYTVYLAEKLGDLVDLWTAINEPTAYASLSYMHGKFPPCEKDPGKYRRVLRHMLLAHAEAYHAIHDVLGKSRMKSAPKVGTVKDTTYFQAYDEESSKDKNEAASIHRSYNAAFLDAIKTGRVGPPLGSGELVSTLKDAWDFIGFNYYTRTLVGGRVTDRPSEGKPLTRKDSLGITDMGWEIYPQGIYQLIKWLKDYGKPIYITENGIAVHDDNIRSMFIVLHLEQVHRAIKELGADVRAYYYWSLIDNFEWDSGFDKRFGLAEVDYKTLKRASRPSAHLYRDIVKNNAITADTLNEYEKLAANL